MKNLLDFNQFLMESELKLAAGLAIVWQGRVLLVHTRGRGPLGWGIPKGGIEPGETPLDAALREVWEETGIQVPPALVMPTAYQYLVNSRWGGKLVHYYLVPVQELEQLGLQEPKVPKGQLQRAEVDRARFMGLERASSSIMASQRPLLMNLQQLGYIQ